jgi:hypothetical protein
MKTANKFLGVLAITLVMAGCSQKFSVGPSTNSGTVSCTGAVSLSSITSPNMAVVATGGNITVAGGALTTDSYNSNNGSYGTGNVSTYGDVEASGKIIVTGGAATIEGSEYINQASNYPLALTQSASLGNLVISASNYTLPLTAGNYYYNTITINGGNFTLSCTGQVRLWFNSLIVNGGNATLGYSTKPGNLWLIGNCGATVSINGGNANLYACLYDPTGIVTLANGGSATVYGAVVGQAVAVNGGSAWVHRDTAL